MNSLVILAIAVVALLLGYTLYGRFLAKKWGIDPKKKTPASVTKGTGCPASIITFWDKEAVLESIKRLVEKNLARFSWPYDYEFRDELPKTLVGKVAYNVLIQEEKMKKKDNKFDSNGDLLEQVIDESDSEELIHKLKVDKK